jgi:hypothetical protein
MKETAIAIHFSIPFLEYDEEDSDVWTLLRKWTSERFHCPGIVFSGGW